MRGERKIEERNIFHNLVYLSGRKDCFILVGPMSKNFPRRIEKKVEKKVGKGHPIEQNDQITLAFYAYFFITSCALFFLFQLICFTTTWIYAAITNLFLCYIYTFYFALLFVSFSNMLSLVIYYIISF